MHIVLYASAALDGRVCYCGNSEHLNLCRASKSVSQNSYFTGSHLRILTILLMTYEIFQGFMFESIHQDFGVFQHAIADYQQYATDVLVDYVETHLEKVGGLGKIVEIDESKIG